MEDGNTRKAIMSRWLDFWPEPVTALSNEQQKLPSRKVAHLCSNEVRWELDSHIASI